MKKHGHVVVKELATGEVISGIINKRGRFISISQKDTVMILLSNEYEILSDLRCEYYIGQELKFQNGWGGSYKGTLLAYESDSTTPYCDENGDWWKHARPIQKEESEEVNKLLVRLSELGYRGMLINTTITTLNKE